jgi:hypothetical protein
MMSRNASLLGSLCVGFVIGGVIVAVTQVHRSPLPAIDSLAFTLWWPGAVGGALVAHSIWALAVGRVSRVTRLLVALNCVAWAGYLVLTPKYSEAELIELQRVRDELSDTSGGINFIEDGASMLAGRPSGFWSVNLSHWVLGLFAGPAMAYSEYVVAERQNGGPPFVGESYVIAVVAFVWSSAFWAAVGPACGFAQSSIRRLTTACSRRRPGGS